jgi:DNA-directed RNA polymerase subunit RPC12/RpoP
MNAKMRAVEKRINGVKGKIVVKQYLATVYDYVCQYCGKEFDSTKKNRKFCCRECCRKSANKNQEAICPIC